MSLAPSRSLFFLAFMAGALTLGASFYLEYGALLRPCFLCQVQRLFLATFTLINLVAAVHNPKRYGIYWVRVGEHGLCRARRNYRSAPGVAAEHCV